MWKIKNYNLREAFGIVESVFAVGVLALLLTGAVLLVVMGINNRKSSFDRRKATELATLVLEGMVAQSQSNPESFWQLSAVNNGSMDGYDNYTYSVGYTSISANPDYPNCGTTLNDCVETVVKIDWQGKNPETLFFNRFFSKNE